MQTCFSLFSESSQPKNKFALFSHDLQGETVS